MARPYIITKKINDLVYRIQLGPKTKPKVVHRNRLWKYSGSTAPNWHQQENPTLGNVNHQNVTIDTSESESNPADTPGGVIELDTHLYVMGLSIVIKCCDLRRGECDVIGYKEH